MQLIPRHEINLHAIELASRGKSISWCKWPAGSDAHKEVMKVMKEINSNMNFLMPSDQIGVLCVLRCD